MSGIFAKIDVDMADHPKVVGLSDAAFRLHVRGILYAKKYLTDGVVDAMPGQDAQCVKELTDAKLWRRDRRGQLVIHDWLDRNLSKKTVEKRRKTRAEAGKKGAEKRWKNKPLVASAIANSMAPAMNREHAQRSEYRDQREEIQQKTALQDLTGSPPRATPAGGRSDEPDSPPGLLCPADLALTAEQVGNAELNFGAQRWQVEAMCAELVGRWCDGETRRPTLAHWRRQLWAAFSSEWKDPAKRPKTKPRKGLTPEQLKARYAEIDRIAEAQVRRNLAKADPDAKPPPLTTDGKLDLAGLLA